MSDLDPFEFSIPTPGGRPGRRAGEGPVNWQVAEEVAAWLARESSQTSAASEDLSFAELFRVVELRIEGLVPPLPPGSTRVFDPSLLTPQEWARFSVREFKYTLETLGSRLAAATEVSAGEIAPVQAIVAPILPVLVGAQFGLLLGRMAAWIWSGFDVLLPRTAAPEPKFLPEAISRAAQEHELDSYDTGLSVCLHEYAHLRQFMVPWLRKFLASEVEKAISGVGFNPEAVAEKLATIDPSDPASIEMVAEDPTGLLDTLMVPAPAETTQRLRAAVAVLEASAEHASAVAAVEIAKDPDKAREAMRRHHLERGKAEGFLLRLAGVDPSPKELASALVFCQFVTAEEGGDALLGLWRSPESLPTFEEMEDPRRWLDRTARAR